jgi:hypothetical protein
LVILIFGYSDVRGGNSAKLTNILGTQNTIQTLYRQLKGLLSKDEQEDFIIQLKTLFKKKSKPELKIQKR